MNSCLLSTVNQIGLASISKLHLFLRFFSSSTSAQLSYFHPYSVPKNANMLTSVLSFTVTTLSFLLSTLVAHVTNSCDSIARRGGKGHRVLLILLERRVEEHAGALGLDLQPV